MNSNPSLRTCIFKDRYNTHGNRDCLPATRQVCACLYFHVTTPNRLSPTGNDLEVIWHLSGYLPFRCLAW